MYLTCCSGGKEAIYQPCDRRGFDLEFVVFTSLLYALFAHLQFPAVQTTRSGQVMATLILAVSPATPAWEGPRRCVAGRDTIGWYAITVELSYVLLAVSRVNGLTVRIICAALVSLGIVMGA